MKKNFESGKVNGYDFSSLNDHGINALTIDEDNTIWCYDYTDSVICALSNDGKKFTSKLYDTITRVKQPVGFISFKAASGHKLWCSSYSLPPFVMDTKTRKITYLSTDPDQIYSLPSSSVNDFCEDDFGAMYVATENGFAAHVNNKFREKIYRLNANLETSNKALNYILTCYEDSGNVVWIGTEGSGLVKFDLSNEKFEQYTYKALDLKHNSVFAIKKINGVYWLGTRRGLKIFDPLKKTITQFPLIKDSLFNVKTVLWIQSDNDNNVWFSNYVTGLYRYNLVSKKIFYYGNSSFEKKFNANRAHRFLLTHDGKVMITCEKDRKSTRLNSSHRT